MTLNDDVNACAGIVQRGDPDRFLATMAAPVAARRILFPLYAFNVEIARAPWVTKESMIAEMRLQWWRDAVEEITNGGNVRRHEVVTPLADIIRPEISAELDEVIAVRRWDIYKDPFEDVVHFERYIDQSAGTLMWVAARLLGAADKTEIETEIETTVRHLGFASGVAAWLRAIPELESMGRIPLLDGTPAGVQSLATNALERLEMARNARGTVPRAAGPALMSAWQTGAILRQAIKTPSDVATGVLGQSEARKRISLMVRAATGRW